MRKRALAVAVLAGMAVAAPGAAAQTPTAGWPACVKRAQPIPLGITEVGRAVNGRIVRLTLRSRALGGEQKVNVLLPERYDRSGRTRYAVLYALHGAGGNHTTLIQGHDLARHVGDMPVIVVAPAGSGPDASGVYRNGTYANWLGVEAGGPGPAFAWESYHVRELIPFIDRTFPTQASAAGRAVFGISMGGGGVRYAAKFPGTFGYAASFSGALATAPNALDCVRGDPALEQVVWRDDSAIDLAANLRGTRLLLRSGDGTPGPFDPAQPADPTQEAIWRVRYRTELLAHGAMQAMLTALRRAGVRGVDAEIYPGSHYQPYWQRELPEFLAWLRTELRRPVTAPQSFTVDSSRAEFTAWGWRLRARRRVREFVYLDVGRRTLRATGSGRLEVTTPARFKPRRRYAVRIGGGAPRRVRADRRGRLALTIDLGPSHTVQQNDFPAGAGTGRGATRGWRTVTARIA